MNFLPVGGAKQPPDKYLLGLLQTTGKHQNLTKKMTGTFFWLFFFPQTQLPLIDNPDIYAEQQATGWLAPENGHAELNSCIRTLPAWNPLVRSILPNVPQLSHRQPTPSHLRILFSTLGTGLCRGADGMFWLEPAQPQCRTLCWFADGFVS